VTQRALLSYRTGQIIKEYSEQNYVSGRLRMSLKGEMSIKNLRETKEIVMKYKKVVAIAIAISLYATPQIGSVPLIKRFPIAKGDQDREKEIFQGFRTISEVVQLMYEKHYVNVNFEEFVHNSLKSGLPTVDPHSAFFTPKSYKAALESTSGEFSGVGVSIMNKVPEDSFLLIIDVIQGGPSYKAGLQNGDKIVEIDDESLKGLSSDEVVNKLRGKIGTTVNMKIIRNKKPLEFKIKREIIKDQSLICYNFKSQGIFYISIKIFAENTARQTAKLLGKINNNCRGIIIDLRKNPGGILESSVDMSGLFVEQNSLIVSTKDKQKKVVNSYHTQNKPVFNKKIPIFILIDNFTASASEIMAGALRHYSEKNQNDLVVILVGTKTFGKGSVQEVIPISNRCALKITTMLYYLPNDISIQALGIEPDFTIKPKTIPKKEIQWVEELYGKETSLKNYIKNGALGEEKKKPEKKEDSKEEIAKNWEERYRKSVGEDPQIKACANMIKLIDVAHQTNKELVSNRTKTIAFLKKNYLDDTEPILEKVS